VIVLFDRGPYLRRRTLSMSFVHSVLTLVLLALLVATINAQLPPRATFDPAPIAASAPGSTAFAFVNSSECDPGSIATIYKLYERNMMVFQTCVSDADYQIFPFSGAYPTMEQIGSMGRSLACRAIFSAALLAGIPECNMAGFPLRAAAETQLKITVDMKNYPTSPAVIPSTERFVDMLHWRRDVNLAEAAGLPSDSKSKLYAEFASNLYTSTTDGLVRLTSGMKVEYRPNVDSSFSQDEIMDLPALRGSSSTDGRAESSSGLVSNDAISADTPDIIANISPVEEGSSSSASLMSASRALSIAAVVVGSLV